ncbi:MAG: hypothetical protein WCP60_11085 [bacterium]
MARPKIHRDPARLNLIIDESVKASAVLLAAKKGLSVGQLVSQLIQREARRCNGPTGRNENSTSPVSVNNRNGNGRNLTTAI